METQIKELTLLLIYLTTWHERDRFVKDGILTSWSGYEHRVLNEFEEKEYFWRSGNNKKLHLTPEGVDKIEELLKKYNFIIRNEIVDKYGFKNIGEEFEKGSTEKQLTQANQKIMELGETIRNLANQSYLFYKPEVEEIISECVIDDDRVERVLEGLLNCFQTIEIEELFNRLCNSYESCNEKLIHEMKQIYHDMYDDSDDEE